MSDCLIAVAHGRVMGEVRSSRAGSTSFAYDDDWLRTGNAFPLSLSVPFAGPARSDGAPVRGRWRGGQVVDAWLKGLLPSDALNDNGQSNGKPTATGRVLSLLARHGQDCAGAVQLVRPPEVPLAIDGYDSGVTWLTDRDIEKRLRGLGPDINSWRLPDDKGRFTLSGGRPKTALFLDRDRWGVPHGLVPTTHIVKPPAPRLPGHCENEHLCQVLARALGIPAAWTRIGRFGPLTALVVTRYDRKWHLVDQGFGEEPWDPMAGERELTRVHQEHLLQSLGSYGRTGEGSARLGVKRNSPAPSSPPFGDLARAVRAHSERPGEDLRSLTRLMILNWIIGAATTPTDLSLLIGAAGRARLAPIHGLVSRIAYPDQPAYKLQLPIAIGGESRIAYVRASHWRRLAVEAGTSPAETLRMCETMAEEIPDRFHDLLREQMAIGVTHPIVRRIGEEIASRARTCLTTLRRGKG